MIYRTLKSVPELAPLPRKERRRVHEQCLRRHFWFTRATARSIAAYAAAMVIPGLFVSLGDTIPASSILTRGIYFIVPVVVGVELGRFVLSRIAIPVLRPFYHDSVEDEI